MATVAKVDGELHSKMAGLNEPKESVTRLPLSNTAIFQRQTGATYQCPALIRRGVLQVGNLLKDGRVDEAKLAPVAATWRALHRDGVRRFMTYAHGPQEGPQRTGAMLPELDTCKLSGVASALAGAGALEERQPEAVWKTL